MKILFVLIVFISTTLNAIEFSIIVNPASSIDNITVNELKAIFLSKLKTLPDGTRAKPVEIAITNFKAEFYNSIAHKSEVELRSYWATLIFTGTGRPPKQMNSYEQLIKYVSSTPGAIAYIANIKTNKSVKVIPLNEE
jgi:ABC-type phosphate transport system substrate-binding protein